MHEARATRRMGAIRSPSPGPAPPPQEPDDPNAVARRTRPAVREPAPGGGRRGPRPERLRTGRRAGEARDRAGGPDGPADAGQPARWTQAAPRQHDPRSPAASERPPGGVPAGAAPRGRG